MTPSQQAYNFCSCLAVSFLPLFCAHISNVFIRIFLTGIKSIWWNQDITIQFIIIKPVKCENIKNNEYHINYNTKKGAGKYATDRSLNERAGA